MGYELPIWRVVKGLGTVPLSVSMSDPDESVEKVSVARKYRWSPTATLRYGSYLDGLESYRSHKYLCMCCDGFVGSGWPVESRMIIVRIVTMIPSLMAFLTYDPYAAPLVTYLFDETVVLQGLEITVHRGSRYVDLTSGLIYIDEVAVTDHRIYG